MTDGADHDEDQFLDTFDRFEQGRMSRELGPIFRAHGVGMPDMTIARAEKHRVADLIRRDQQDAAREDARKLADLEVRRGLFINLADIVIEPTPEWLDKGDVKSFTPKQPEGTVRTIKTVRRVVTPIIARMHGAGKLTDEQYSACMWYRLIHDQAGLEGRYSSSQFNATSSVSRSTKTGGFAGHMAMHHSEAEAREMYRAARAAITPFYLKFFEKVVLDDLPIRRAARFAKCRDDRAVRRFRDVAVELVGYCERVKSIVPDIDDQGHD